MEEGAGVGVQEGGRQSVGWCSIGVVVGAGLVVFAGVVGLVGWLRCGGVYFWGRELVCQCGGGLMLVGFSGLFAGVLLVLVDGGSWALGWCVCFVSIYSWGYAFVGGSCALVVGCVGGICLDSLVAGVIGMCSLLGWWWLWLCCVRVCMWVWMFVLQL